MNLRYLTERFSPEFVALMRKRLDHLGTVEMSWITDARKRHFWFKHTRDSFAGNPCITTTPPGYACYP